MEGGWVPIRIGLKGGTRSVDLCPLISAVWREMSCGPPRCADSHDSPRRPAVWHIASTELQEPTSAVRAVPASSWQIPMDSFKVVKAAAKAAKGRAPQLQYPRLALFRQILRAHERHLPAAHRELGDAYVREEFRAHRKASVRRARLPKHTSCK